jgi:hypothetical protein
MDPNGLLTKSRDDHRHLRFLEGIRHVPNELMVSMHPLHVEKNGADNDPVEHKKGRHRQLDQFSLETVISYQTYVYVYSQKPWKTTSHVVIKSHIDAR